MNEYEIIVVRKIIQSTTVKVTADNKTEAKTMAVKQAKLKNIKWETLPGIERPIVVKAKEILKG